MNVLGNEKKGLYLSGVFVSHSSRSYVWDGAERRTEYDLISVDSSVLEIRYPSVLPAGMLLGGGHCLGDYVLYRVTPSSGKSGVVYTLMKDVTDIPIP